MSGKAVDGSAVGVGKITVGCQIRDSEKRMIEVDAKDDADSVDHDGNSSEDELFGQLRGVWLWADGRLPLSNVLFGRNLRMDI